MTAHCARRFCIAATALAAISAAPETLAQLPSEEVVVTAPRLRPDSVIDNFVMSHAAPAPMLGKIARWKGGMCPETSGLAPHYAAFITARLRQIATLAGAPLQAAGNCRVNIEILFTTTPQALLDNVRKTRPLLLGFYSPAQAGRIATVSHAVQAWYGTETEDWNGIKTADNARTQGMQFLVQGGSGLRSAAGPAGASIPDVTMNLPSAGKYQVRGNRLGDGLSSELFHVMVVVDPGKVADYEVGALADYIAVLALSQTASFDVCQDAPSITNLLAENCGADRKPDAITDFDLAFLRGFYSMDLAGTFQTQQRTIASAMKAALDGH